MVEQTGFALFPEFEQILFPARFDYVEILPLLDPAPDCIASD
jgi:hypothetical protein